MVFKILQKHIDEGISSDLGGCMLHKAAQDAGVAVSRVGAHNFYSTWGQWVERTGGAPHDEAVKFRLNQFDKDKSKVKPFEVELTDTGLNFVRDLVTA